MCIPLPQANPPTEECRKHVKRLEILLIVQLVAMVLSIMVSSTMFLYMLFSALMLYLAYTQLDYCSTIIYIFFAGSQLLDLLLTFGTFWQNDITVSEYGVYPFVIYIILTVFLAVAIWIVFKAYKEFKAVAFGRAGYSVLGGGNDQPDNQAYGAVGKKHTD